MIFRDALPSDHSDIVRFQIAMARETEDLDLDPEICSRGVAAVLADATLGRYFIAEEDGKVAGGLMVTYEWSDWRNGTVWWIQSVYIETAFRRRGVYAGLYEHVRKLVEANGSLRGIRLYVDKRNVNAQEVYRRLGMNGEHYTLFEWMKE
jgi:GNAT superfamily N-acetyltransferase